MTPVQQARGIGLLGFAGWALQAPLWWHLGFPGVAVIAATLAGTALVLTVRL